MLRAAVVVLGLAGMVVVVAPTPRVAHQADSHADRADTYTCPMHPEIVSDKPGRCPKCKMKLVPK